MKKSINEQAEAYAKMMNLPLEQFHNLYIVQSNRDNENWTLSVWKGKQRKPMCHYLFSSLEKRNNYVTILKSNHLKKIQREEEAKQAEIKEQKEFATSLKTGDILVSSWGYEQTNVNYYQIVQKKGMTVIIQEIAKKITSTEYQDGEAMPLKDHFKGKPEKRRIGAGYIRVSTFDSCHPWNGEADYCSWGR